MSSLTFSDDSERKINVTLADKSSTDHLREHKDVLLGLVAPGDEVYVINMSLFYEHNVLQ